MAKVTLNTLQTMKEAGNKITCLTAYDSTFASLVSSQGIDVILVGDSLGMVCQGKNSTVPVTMADMCYHTRSVYSNISDTMLMADLPFASYTAEDQALHNATQLMQAGAEIIKIEGESWLAPIVTHLRRYGIPTCVHMGFTPQSVNVFGGYKVQGREADRADALVQSALTLEKAGAAAFVLECVPTALAQDITRSVKIPVIGIGAGSATDGQILVIYDMLGLTPGRLPRFVKNFMDEAPNAQTAVNLYKDAVKSGLFPTHDHGFQ